MADLGVISTSVDSVYTSFPIPNSRPAIFSFSVDTTGEQSKLLPYWLGADAFNYDTTGVINVSVTILGANAPYIKVHLYLHRTGLLVQSQKTDVNGVATFTGLVKGSPEYFAVAVTDQAFNAVVFDKLTPE